MKLIHVVKTKSIYIIPIFLFLGSFLVYSYNLAGQPWHGDEIVYLSWAGNYVHLIKEGDLDNSCLISLDKCDLLFHIPAYGLTYSHIRNLLIGFPMEVEPGDVGKFYNWSCYWQCYIHDMGPTVQEMTSSRLFSPVFGSLTVAVSFLVGSLLFNRFVGIAASLFFLFYDLWLWYSRTIMTEVHYIFFLMLSLLFLLYAFKSGCLKIKFLVLSAISFGIALSLKMLAVEFIVLFASIIIFGSLHKKQTARKQQIPKTSLLIFLFFSISILSLFITLPGFYENPLNQIKIMKTDMDNYNRDVWYIGYPTVHNLQFDRIISLFHSTLVPSPIEHQMSGPYPNSVFNVGWNTPQTYSSIVLTTFFFIGFGCLINKIRKLKGCIPETMGLIWFVSTFIITLLIAKDFSLERYILPLFISIIFIASYGFWNFIKKIPNNKIKISFVIYSVFAHSVTGLLSWKQIYFSSGTMWTNPLNFGTLQESLDNQFTLGVNSIFFIFLLVVFIIQFRKKVTSSVIVSK